MASPENNFRAVEDDPAAKARRHREILADFGLQAVLGREVRELIDAAAASAAEALSVKRSKVLVYRRDSDDLLVAAGVGWDPGVVGHATLSSGMESPPGRAYRTGEAVFIECITDEPGFVYSELLRSHGIVSLVNVPIKTGDFIYGVLEVDSEVQRRFSDDDRNFLISFANFVAAAVQSRNQEAALAAAARQREALLKELRSAKEVYQRASLAKGRLLAAAGHDLKQPLQVIRASVEMVAPHVSPARHRRHLDRMERAVRKLDHALDRLIYASHIESGEVQPRIIAFPIARLLGTLADEFAPLAKEKELDFKVVTSSVSVLSDPDLLDSILQNFVSNAIKYTDEGRVLVGCHRRGGVLSVEVHDTGIGIPMESMDTVFEEFRQMHSGREGIGLGLSIVKRTADLLNHRVTVHSVLGVGSCFQIDLPIAPQET